MSLVASTFRLLEPVAAFTQPGGKQDPPPWELNQAPPRRYWVYGGRKGAKDLCTLGGSDGASGSIRLSGGAAKRLTVEGAALPNLASISR